MSRITISPDWMIFSVATRSNIEVL